MKPTSQCHSLVCWSEDEPHLVLCHRQSLCPPSRLRLALGLQTALNSGRKLWMFGVENASYGGLTAKICPKEDSLGVQVVGDVNDNGRSVHDGNNIVNGDVNTTHSLKRWSFTDWRLEIGTSSPEARLQGFLSIKSRLVPTQREGILNNQLSLSICFKF